MNPLLYLLTKKCIHRELNAHQVLFRGKTVKLAAVGHYKLNVSEALKNNECANYISPQILRNRPYSSKTDVFSLGVLAYQILQDGSLPWGSIESFKDRNQYLEKIKEPLKFKKQISEVEKDFVSKCLQYYEDKRMSIV